MKTLKTKTVKIDKFSIIYNLGTKYHKDKIKKQIYSSLCSF